MTNVFVWNFTLLPAEITFTKKFGHGEKLACKHDTREKAQLYDDYAVGIYLDEGEGIEKNLLEMFL